MQPEYVVTVQNKQFLCEAILPDSSPLRGAVGRPAGTKQIAKCSAAFETCLKLVEGKYLDESLQPIFTKQLPAMRNALLAVDSKKRESYDMKTKPAMWSISGVPELLYMTLLVLEMPEAVDRPCQPLALLARVPLPQLPSFYLHFGAGRHSQVLTTPLDRPWRVSSEFLQLINTFTLCIFDDVFSKGYESDPSKMPYFLVPIASGSEADVDFHTHPTELIAWDILRSIQDHHTKWSGNPWDNKSWQTEPDEFLKDKYIVDPFDGSRKLWTVGVTQEYKPLDPVPPNSAPRKGTRKNNENIMEYSCSLWAKARSRRTFDSEQRVIQAEFIPLRRNLLDDFDGPEEETPKKCFIILEPLKISPVRMSAPKYELPLTKISSSPQRLLLWHTASPLSFTEWNPTSSLLKLVTYFTLRSAQTWPWKPLPRTPITPKIMEASRSISNEAWARTTSDLSSLAIVS
jgi:endoribonuclease Dicer